MSLNFQKSDNISKPVQDRHNGCNDSLIGNRMWPMPLKLNDLEGYFCCLKPF